MVSKIIEVVNAEGLHMRPAGILAAEMKNFAGCKVTLKVEEKTIKATSAMQIMAAGIKCGSKIEITAEGENEQAALDKAAALFENGFGE